VEGGAVRGGRGRGRRSRSRRGEEEGPKEGAEDGENEEGGRRWTTYRGVLPFKLHVAQQQGCRDGFPNVVCMVEGNHNNSQ
jgi:hypothetical protein